ncbi:penicillin-binding transpeptidase domain-containing protein [Bdellovibrio svalbardensis]|uniref:Penicillin-binding transpeptidase domain-containing protein n=1 Tax=Bdellovibrio svalbardensis TaxID=2972972 RepID=A0ABT6DGY3_9BACT|nr:penicillin-binding transpeptidase domain-containing protein [Bdellovibrio svalbardensis]MDG0816073.1 penicillin-binding transpeptidase domain-containing protein [Bdellovibrio svalbardensis]
MVKLAKTFLISFVVFYSFACTSTAEKKDTTLYIPPAPPPPPQMASAFNMLTDSFADLEGCFLLFDMKLNDYVEEFNSPRCRQPTSPCSTFKVPLAVMAFDSGILKDEDSTFKWDGRKNTILAWNKDQTAKSWMQESVVWYSQRITQKLGRKKVQSYLDKFQYGNHDFSGGLTTAWLTGGPVPHENPKSSVLISGYEQVDFMKKLWTSQLPASQAAMDLTRKITFLEMTPRGFKLSGKTGSGFMPPEFKQRLGWFVAHIEGKDQEFIAVATFNDKGANDSLSGGKQAKQILIEALKAHGLY